MLASIVRVKTMTDYGFLLITCITGTYYLYDMF